METMAKYDAATLPAIFQQPPAVRTIAMFKYPDVFFGTADVWCSGAAEQAISSTPPVAQRWTDSFLGQRAPAIRKHLRQMLDRSTASYLSKDFRLISSKRFRI
jgi:hypothetical protein